MNRKKKSRTDRDLERENEELRASLDEAQETLGALQRGEVDSIVISGPDGPKVFTLQTAEQPYRIIVESINEGAATLDSSGTVLYSNTRLAKMLKLPLEKVIGATFHELVAEKDVFDRLFKKGLKKSSRGEITVLIRNRPVLPAYVSLNPLHIDTIPNLSMIVTDITGRKKAEEELRTAYAGLEIRIRERTAEIRRAQEELQFANSRLNGIIEGTTDHIAALDLGYRFIAFNTAYKKEFNDVFGTVIELGMSLIDALVDWPEEQSRAAEIWGRALRGEEFSTEFEFGPRKGVRKHYSVTFSGIRDDRGHLIGASHIIHDITWMKRIEEELRKSEEQLSALLKASSHVLYRMGPDWKELMELHGGGFVADTEKPNRNWMQEYIHPEDREMVLQAINHSVQTGSVFELEHRVMQVDGTFGWTFSRAVPLRNAAGQIVEWFGAASDITGRKRMEDEIRHMAHHDSLTGLPNRRMFMDIMELEKAQAQRNHKRLAVLFLDLDRFKEINDTLGHNIGDGLLKEVAVRIRKNLRASDTVARVGGDEFNVILADIGRAEHVPDAVRKILESFSDPFVIEEHKLSTTPSIGISLFPDDAEDTDSLLRYADIAMYHSKEKGRNTYRFFSPEMNTRITHRLKIEDMLRRTIESGELVVYYQPQLNASTRQIVCAEALVRWQHPELGLLEPADFLPLAEETGLITNIDEWALRAACSQARNWSDAGLRPVCVTVNISEREFRKSDMVDRVLRTLDETGLPPERLKLEIRECVAMNDIEHAIARLKELAEIGVYTSLDDFGSGCSSLHNLKRLPVRKLNIDRSFIRDLETDSGERTVISALMLMAHAMGLKTAVGGVERDDQFTYLRSVNCDEVQGYLFSKPVPAAEFSRMIALPG
jgi:diguanylate cyclase (GGDEF)-like protein/PAS domain S-box-containing protein